VAKIRTLRSTSNNALSSEFEQLHERDQPALPRRLSVRWLTSTRDETAS
jgi:hypothetical protein